MEFNEHFSKKEKYLFAIASIILIFITFLTQYYGSTDIGDYADTAKYFAGDYSAKLRVSHSMLYGFIMSPLVKIFESFFVFKIVSLIFLVLLVYSVYIASGRDKNAFWLMFFSPIVWYMAPWISSVQLSSLLFFWAYFFIKKYSVNGKLKFLFFSGVLAGLSWAFWDALLFFVIFLGIAFLYNKKLYKSVYFLIFVLIGLLPKLILDQWALGFAFLGILRYFSGVVTASFFGGIYGGMAFSNFPFRVLVFLLFVPLLSYKLFSKEFWIENLSSLGFVILSLLLLLKQTQARYFLLIAPIIIFEIIPLISKSQIRKCLIFSITLIILLQVPYTLQIKSSLVHSEITSIIFNKGNLQTLINSQESMHLELKKLSEDIPNQTFVVGNAPDDYAILASLYWEKDIKELVSIQDYTLFLENKTILFEKRFMPVPKIQERRQIWIAGGISKNENDKTNYSSIVYGIGIEEPINLTGFTLIKKYDSLYLSKKSSF